MEFRRAKGVFDIANHRVDEEDRHPEVKIVLERMDGDTTGSLGLERCGVANRPWWRKQQRRLSVIQVDDRSAQLPPTLHFIWQADLAHDDIAVDCGCPVMWQALIKCKRMAIVPRR